VLCLWYAIGIPANWWGAVIYWYGYSRRHYLLHNVRLSYNLYFSACFFRPELWYTYMATAEDIICYTTFACLIIRTFQLVFSTGTVFFSHTKLANSTFSHDFSAKRTRHCLCCSSAATAHRLLSAIKKCEQKTVARLKLLATADIWLWLLQRQLQWSTTEQADWRQAQ
jgi:hypothetical protein